MGAGESFRVQLLGPVRAWSGEHELRLGGPKQRAVLGILATRCNRTVSRGELVDGVWGDDPPPSAENALYVYIARLRGVLEPNRSQRGAGRLLTSTGSGYQLRLEPGQLDVDIFQEHLDQARGRARRGELTEATQLFDAALRLWRGAPYTAIQCPFAEFERTRLRELHLTAIEDRAEAMLALGRHVEMTAELSKLVHEYPLRERLRRLLMVTLYRCGRQAEALSVFADIRRVLLDELGIDPGPELQQLHGQVLANDPALDPPVVTAVGDNQRPVPAQLPHDMPGFAGRDAELARLRALLPAEHADPTGSTALIATIDGPAGVGKTALAVHFGHRLADRFPDGQLYVNLRGFDPDQPALTAAEALAHFFYSLGADPAQVPADLDKQAAMYRTLLAGKRLLVVLDNAATAEQVRPLLPGTATCLALVTSRNRLPGLMARDGASRITLDVLASEDAVALLARIAGPDRIAAQPAAAGTMARLCGYLPLALRITAERLASHPDITLADALRDLTDERGRLDALAADGDEVTAVRAVLSWSYRVLEPEAARVFRLLSLHAGPDISGAAAAAIAGVTVERARATLGVLTGRHLLEQSGRDRYRFHDLVRLYAAELADAEDSEQDRGEAILRVLHWYLHTADAADRVLIPQRRHVQLGPPQADCRPHEFGTPGEALSWCEAERPNLVAAVRQAAEIGQDGIAWRLPIALWGFFSLHKPWADWITVTSVGLTAASRAHDVSGQAHTLTSLGNAYQDIRGFDDAIDHFRRALAAWRETGDCWGQAATLVLLGMTYYDLGRLDDALAQFEPALALFGQIGDRWGQGWTLHSLSRVHLDRRSLDEAVDSSRRALAVFREIGDRWGQSWVHYQLGNGYWKLRLGDDALRHYHRALTVCQEIGNRHGEGYVLVSLANAYRDGGRLSDAIDYCRRALALFRGIGDRRGEDETLRNLAKVLQNLDGTDSECRPWVV